MQNKQLSAATRAYIQMTHRYLANHYERFPVAVESGQGCWVKDVDGRRYLDMFADYSVHNFGRSNSQLLMVFIDQVTKLSLCAGNFYNPFLAQLGKALAEFSGILNAKFLPGNSGAEAVEKTLKIARRWGCINKKLDKSKGEVAEIIAAFSNFHGRTMGALSLSANQHYKEGFGPFLPGIRWVKFGDAADLKRAINKNTAAFIVEPIQGEGGFIFPPDGYFKEVAKICHEENVLLILDEIPTAFARTGYNFPHEHDGITPDMIILGKALGGGLTPFSGVVVRQPVMDVLGPGSDGSTFAGNPPACRVGLEVIKMMQSGSWTKKAHQLGDYFLQSLKELDSPHIKEVRGRGLFVGVQLHPEIMAREVCGRLLEEGIMTVSAGQNVIRFTPPLVVNKIELELAVKALHRVLSKISPDAHRG
ncbi:MAG: ornithine--oxo-acid transaminase [Patescibacteria group bacterium]